MNSKLNFFLSLEKRKKNASAACTIKTRDRLRRLHTNEALIVSPIRFLVVLIWNMNILNAALLLRVHSRTLTTSAREDKATSGARGSSSLSLLPWLIRCTILAKEDLRRPNSENENMVYKVFRRRLTGYILVEARHASNHRESEIATNRPTHLRFSIGFSAGINGIWESWSYLFLLVSSFKEDSFGLTAPHREHQVPAA